MTFGIVPKVDFNNTVFAPKNIMAFMISTDKAMDEKLAETLKAIFEIHARKITGLQVGYEVQKELPGPRTLLKSVPVKQTVAMEFVEKYGSLIHHALDAWFKSHIENRTPEDLQLDGVDLLFIEPDPTHTVVTNVWYMKGIYPSNVGCRSAEKNTVEPRSGLVLYEIEFNGEISYNNEAHFKLAKELLDKIQGNIKATQPEAVVTAKEENPFISEEWAWCEINHATVMAIQIGGNHLIIPVADASELPRGNAEKTVYQAKDTNKFYIQAKLPK